ncbi:hypothetical protein GZH47_26710 [Paenibacillus rhizovicinus]|uniref:(2Fe-2S)-binding protein n=1 Tax=Paenibacillus rhizovicinus TaxID=2704463 RepID=A0A6C0P6P7_9BACL|nr:hypothetical protein [Paenibacillus rhizovicinus]QHW34031.1 hypothetical protein GZH47_26710 [Paenibacillus rhizovicinus]
MTTAYDFSLVKTYLHISPEGVEHVLDEMPAVDFYRIERLQEMMDKAGAIVQATDRLLAGSFIGTSLCNLCVTKLIFMAMYGKVLDLPLTNLSFQIDYEEGHGHPHFGYRINEVLTRDIPAESGDAFVKADWERFMVEDVTPAVEAIAEAADMKPEIIWAQFGGNAGYVKDFVRKMELPAEFKARFDHHFQLLSEAIEAEAFNRKRNPFQWKPRYVDNPYQAGEQWPMKSGCCQYDRREGGTKCFTCPRMSPAEREQELQRIQAAALV